MPFRPRIRPRPRTAATVIAVVGVVVTAACGSGDGSTTAPSVQGRPSVSTTTVTTAAAVTTTAVPVPRSEARAVISPAGVVVPVVSHTDTGWVVRTPCGTTANLTEGTPVGPTTIVVDPGHGGTEPGAVSPAGLREADVNLEVSRHLQAALEAAGVSVLLTRLGNYDLNLSPRAEIARTIAPRAFVSIHHNAEPDGPWPGPGSETYYQIASPDSKRLAGLIYEEVVRTLAAYQVTWVADRDAGAKYRPGENGDYYAMLRQPRDVVSVLVESAFVSNPPEAALLDRPDVQQAEGGAVARGILRYLDSPDPGSGFTEPYPRTEPPSAPGGTPRCVEPRL